MEIVYLGLLSKIFNFIFDAILSPVFKFISSLLETVLGWLFENVLGPVLQSVLLPIFEGLVKLVFEILAGIIYSIFASLLNLLDSLQTIFHIFAGIKPVRYAGRAGSYPLIEMVFRMERIQKSMLLLIAVAFVLTMLFAVLGTVRSIMDLDGSSERPVSRVLSSTMRAMIHFLLIPFTSLFLIVLSGHILTGIHTALGGSDTSLGRMVFVVSSLDASRRAEYNISGKTKDTDEAVTPSSRIGIGDDIRKPYYDGRKSYTETDVVKKDFDFARFDYLIGFLAAIFLLIVLSICVVNFINRIFEVMLLFVASPFFVCTMPLDDGERFRGWQDMFVAKLFGGYGSVIAMQLYMLICPKVIEGSIIFSPDATVEANYLIRLVFLLGGAWAVVKSGPSVTQLLNHQAGEAERETGRTVTSGLMAAAEFTKDTGKAIFRGYKNWKAGKGTGKQPKGSSMKAAKRKEPDGRTARVLNKKGGGGNTSARRQSVRRTTDENHT